MELEARSAYGYFGCAGGVTGETPSSDWNCVPVKMYYWEYKDRYPECRTLHDYDKVHKTITVLIPHEYTERPNFGNRYSIRDFHFTYSPPIAGFSNKFECRAKCYKNALRAAKKWAKENGVTITGDAPGHENQSDW